jgi:hypothetical protein
MSYKPNYTALSLQNKALNLKMNDLQLRFFHEIRSSCMQIIPLIIK